MAPISQNKGWQLAASAVEKVMAIFLRISAVLLCGKDPGPIGNDREK